MKRFVIFTMILCMLMPIGSGAFAREDNFGKELDTYLRTIDKEYKVENSEALVRIDFESISNLDKETKKKVIDLIDEHGIDTIEELIQDAANEMQPISSMNETMNVYEYQITDEDLNEDGELNITNLEPFSSVRRYSKDQYHLVQFPKSFTIEYLVRLGLSIRVANGKFDYVSGSDFNMLTMSTGGSYTNVRRSYIFNNARTTCSYNVNYTVQFGFDIPIFDLGLPVLYEKPAHDALIVYY